MISPDEGYSTGGDLTSPGTSPGGSTVGEVLGVQARGRGEEREARRGEERPVRGQGVVGPWVPVVQVAVRRSTPQEDFLWSLQVCTRPDLRTSSLLVGKAIQKKAVLWYFSKMA